MTILLVAGDTNKQISRHHFARIDLNTGNLRSPITLNRRNKQQLHQIPEKHWPHSLLCCFTIPINIISMAECQLMVYALQEVMHDLQDVFDKAMTESIPHKLSMLMVCCRIRQIQANDRALFDSRARLRCLSGDHAAFARSNNLQIRAQHLIDLIRLQTH